MVQKCQKSLFSPIYVSLNTLENWHRFQTDKLPRKTVLFSLSVEFMKNLEWATKCNAMEYAFVIKEKRVANYMVRGAKKSQKKPGLPSTQTGVTGGIGSDSRRSVGVSLPQAQETTKHIKEGCGFSDCLHPNGTWRLTSGTGHSATQIHHDEGRWVP